MTRAAILCSAALWLGCSSESSEPSAKADPKTAESKTKTPSEPSPEAKAETKNDPTLTPAVTPAPSKPPPADPAAIAKARKLYLARLNEGRRLTKAGQFPEAIAVYLQALDVDPSDVALLGELGWAAFKGNDLPGARHATTHGLRFARTDKQRGMLNYNLGRIAEAEGDQTRAAELYQESLRARDNATVRKRLATLTAPPPTTAASGGLPVLAEGLPTLEQACASLIRTECDEWLLYEDDECQCDPALTSPGADWAGLLVLNAGMAQEVYYPVLNTSAGYTVMAEALDNYNPGVFGIYGELEITTTELIDDLLGAGVPGWHFEFRKDRMDRDMGINEIEGEHWIGHVFCAREGAKARCTRPVVVDYGYDREVEFPDEDEPGMTHEDLPMSSSYSDDAHWSAGTLTITAKGRDGITAVEDGMTTGSSLPAGTHALRDLMDL